MSKYITRPVKILMVSAGTIMGLWSLVALVSGLNQVNWQVTTFMHHLFTASGLIGPLHTMVDFYTHIKGVEYIICVLFFVVFPLYFRYVERTFDKRKTPVKMTEKRRT